MTVLDAHCDAPSQMYRLRDFSRDNDHAQVDFPKMKRGGVDASFFALYVPASKEPVPAREYALALLAETRRQVAANPGTVRFAVSAEEVKKNQSEGLISILLGLENGTPLLGAEGTLEYLYEAGVRYVTLTHSADNLLCDSCTGKGTWGGLSARGREMVREMNRIGMLVDVAHCSDDTVRDCLRLSRAPIAYTHGCCRALASHRRDLSDDLIRGIAREGGVVGMSIYPPFLSDAFVRTLEVSGLEEKAKVEDDFIRNPADESAARAWFAVLDELAALPRPGVEKVVDHIEHALVVAGEEHVGIGTDFDGIEVTAEGLETIASFRLIFSEMRRRGWSEELISGVAGGNFLRLLDSVQEAR